MKNKLLLTLLACAGWMLSGCETNPDELNSQKHYMQLEMVGEEYESNKPFPCAVIDYDEWVMVQYTADGLEHTDIMPFLCVNKVHDLSYLLMGYEDMVVLAEFDMLKGTTGEYAVFMSTVDGYNKYSLAKISYENGAPSGYQTISEMTERDSNDGKKMSRAVDFNREYNTSTVRIIMKHLNEFDTKVSMWLDAAGTASGVFKGAISMLGLGISGVTNAIRGELLNVPELDTPTKIDLKTDMAESIILSVIKRPWRMMWNAELYALKKTGVGQIFIDQFQEWHEALTKKEPIDEIPMFSSHRVIDNWHKMKTEIATLPPQFELSLDLKSVGETSATLRASYECLGSQMSYVSAMGIECWQKTTGDKITLESGNFSGDLQLSGLTPLTEYICYAYMNSFGTKYTSKSVEFITKGELTLTPTGLHFQASGGTENVFFSLQRDNISTWDYTAPAWCKIEKYEDWFRVVVGENTGKQALSGSVDISMALSSGQKTTASLKVSQDKPETIVTPEENENSSSVGSGSWDGTTWYFTNASNSKYDFHFTVKNLANQNVTYGGFLDNSNWAPEANLIEKTEEGLFIGKQGSWNNVGIHKAEIKIVRTGSKTAKAYLNYQQIPIFGNTHSEDVVLDGKRK